MKHSKSINNTPQTITHNPQPNKANQHKQRKSDTSKHDQNNQTNPRTVDASKNEKSKQRGKHIQSTLKPRLNKTEDNQPNQEQSHSLKHDQQHCKTLKQVLKK